MVTLREILDRDPPNLPAIKIVAVEDQGGFQCLVEGIWINGRYDQNIRIDRDTHFADAGEKNFHAHIYGRRDRDNAIVAVRQNGASSHGLSGKLHKDDAQALRNRGFAIRADNIVEFVVLSAPAAQILNESLRMGDEG